MGTSDLYALARARLSAGELPLEKPQLLLGAHGCGACCSLCGAPITAREIEYEIEVTGKASFRFHIRCYDAWETVRNTTASLSRSQSARPAATDDAPRRVLDRPAPQTT